MTNAFERYWSLGYTSLIPIIPPDAKISERSSLAKRVGTRMDGRGKTPGVKGGQGEWYSFDWLQHTTDEADCQRWHRMGAGVGIRTGEGILAIDADTLDEGHAKTIHSAVLDLIGQTPIRVGNYPKALYLVWCDTPYRYARVEFGPLNERGYATDRVEILTEGRQFVAEGIHPKTKKPYTWPRPILPVVGLPKVTPEQIDQLLERLRQTLPAAKPVIREGAASGVDQRALKGDIDTVRKAIEAMPNTSEYFPTREHFIQVGYALKAALPDDPNTAFDLYADWAARWEDDTNPPDYVQSEWSRMKAPFKLGAGWLYEQAEKTSAGKFREVDAWFGVIEEDDNPFATIREQEAQQTVGLYPVLTIGDLLARPPPEWLIADYFPKKSVGFVFSAPGAGKTFLVLDAMMTIAAGGTDWHGKPIAPSSGLVLYLAAEGSYGFRNRIKAWLQARERTVDDVGSFRLIEQTINFMHTDDVVRLIKTIEGVLAGSGRALAAVVIDTVSRAMPGADENLQKDMTLFVRACDAVKDRFGCSVVGVHHAGKSGDMRGSTVLNGAGDFVFSIAHKKGSAMRRVTCEKMKDGPDGWEAAFRYDLVELGDGASSLVVAACEDVGPSVVLTPDTAGRVLEAMRAAWDDGAPWSRHARAGERWAVRRMVADFGFDAEKASETLGFWEATGAVSYGLHSAKTRISGYQVGVDPGQPVQNEGIFG